MAELEPPDVRYWVEFPDPAAPPGQSVAFRCDLTWLTSTWHCIFGAGCPGIVAGRPDDGCCTYGAHLCDAADARRVADAAARLTPQQWQHAPGGALDDSVLFRGAVRGPRPGAGEDGEGEHGGDWDGGDGEITTQLVDGACLFLNRPGFPTGPGCALHLLALAEGVPVTMTKPEVCWQLPIRRWYSTVESPDEVVTQVIHIGEFGRPAWGPGGHDLDWYCTWSQEAHGAGSPLYLRAAAELEALMGPPGYAELVAHAQAFIGPPARLG